jgi:hypothetical protein
MAQPILNSNFDLPAEGSLTQIRSGEILQGNQIYTLMVLQKE